MPLIRAWILQKLSHNLILGFKQRTFGLFYLDVFFCSIGYILYDQYTMGASRILAVLFLRNTTLIL